MAVVIVLPEQDSVNLYPKGYTLQTWIDAYGCATVSPNARYVVIDIPRVGLSEYSFEASVHYEMNTARIHVNDHLTLTNDHRFTLEAVVLHTVSNVCFTVPSIALPAVY